MSSSEPARPLGTGVRVAPVRNLPFLALIFTCWGLLRGGRVICLLTQELLPFRFPLLWLGDPQNWWPPRPWAGRLGRPPTHGRGRGSRVGG